MFLEKIAEHKRKELEVSKKNRSLKGMKTLLDKCFPSRRFRDAVAGKNQNKEIKGSKIIAEVKKASPSKGVIREDFNPLQIALTYQKNGAVAISVLTDEKFFQGSLNHMHQVAKSTIIPILRKDFIIDEYQVLEARACRADAFLLIAGLLDKERLRDFRLIGEELGMDALVEVHTMEELEKALLSGAGIIGINNRDLATFEVDIKRSIEMVPHIPKEKLIVSDSGIKSREDIIRLEEAGVNAFLIGETLLKSNNIGKKLKELIGISD